MAKRTLGKLPPRYTQLFNRHPHERLSKCPICRRPTFKRKFPLVIHIDDFGLMALGKTAPYCARCELIVVHQHELEAEMAFALEKLDPDAIGNEYLVVGTQDRKTWKQGLGSAGRSIEESLETIADFKKYLELEVDRGGWRFEP